MPGQRGSRCITAVKIILAQPVKFIIVGFLNTLISLLIYFICFKLLKLNYLVSLIVAYAAGILNSYLWNSRWTFGIKKYNAVSLVKFLLVYLFTFMLNLLILIILVKVVRIPVLISQSMALAIATLFSFAAHKLWSFKGSPETMHE